MSAEAQVRASAPINPNHDLYHFRIEVGRVVIMLEAAKDNLLNRSYPAAPDFDSFFDEVDAHLEVCARYLQGVHAEMEAAEATGKV